MKTVNFAETCITVSSSRPFEQVTNAIESIVGKGKNLIFRKLLDSNASCDQLKSAVESMVGPSGFILFAHFESGRVLSLCGKPKKAKLYVIGNPLIANQMFEQNPAVGLYVPLRLFVYDDYNGKTYVAYDKPSSLLGQFQDETILRVAQMLDQKLEELVTRAVY
ncbi:MAG: DUF302 domain-containing protein [Xenococcaceae cyanobacterium]